MIDVYDIATIFIKRILYACTPLHAFWAGLYLFSSYLFMITFSSSPFLTENVMLKCVKSNVINKKWDVEMCQKHGHRIKLAC